MVGTSAALLARPNLLLTSPCGTITKWLSVVFIALLHRGKCWLDGDKLLFIDENLVDGENSSESLVKKLLTTVRNWLLDSLDGVGDKLLSLSSSSELWSFTYKRRGLFIDKHKKQTLISNYQSCKVFCCDVITNIVM